MPLHNRFWSLIVWRLYEDFTDAFAADTTASGRLVRMVCLLLLAARLPGHFPCEASNHGVAPCLPFHSDFLYGARVTLKVPFSDIENSVKNPTPFSSLWASRSNWRDLNLSVV